MPSKYLAKFEPGFFYHVYNRAVGNDKLFYEDADYQRFMDLLNEKLSKFAFIYAYCLLPNHYHLLIKVKDDASLRVTKDIPQQFRKLGITYVRSINKKLPRRGTLFMRPYKRKKIVSDENLYHVLFYIHLNPVNHGINPSFENYPWSSYKSIVSGKADNLVYSRVIELFHDKANLIQVHQWAFHNKMLKLLEEWEFEK
ncbi:MAG: transposase [Bacteroidetes bacterium]|nr:transposase [Bacteroidota bacterium]